VAAGLKRLDRSIRANRVAMANGQIARTSQRGQAQAQDSHATFSPAGSGPASHRDQSFARVDLKNRQCWSLCFAV
jgi:hypothetical protein